MRHSLNLYGLDMNQEEHENISLAMFGEKHRKVHEFLDQFFPKYGIYHRVFLHHQLGISLVVQKFLGAVRPVAEQHIIDDMAAFPMISENLILKLNMQIPGCLVMI